MTVSYLRLRKKKKKKASLNTSTCRFFQTGLLLSHTFQYLTYFISIVESSQDPTNKPASEVAMRLTWMMNYQSEESPYPWLRRRNETVLMGAVHSGLSTPNDAELRNCWSHKRLVRIPACRNTSKRSKRALGIARCRRIWPIQGKYDGIGPSRTSF